MRKALIILAVLAMSVGIVFAEGKEDDGTYKVAYIARAQGDSFAAWLANSVKEEMDKYPDMSVDIMDGQAKNEVVNSYIENSITNRYDLIILQPNNNEAQTPYVKQVVDAGIPIILTNPRIPALMGQGVNSVDADPYEQGAVNARLGFDQIPKNANVVILTGPSGNMHSDMRREAWQKECLDKRPDINVVGEQIANWNKDEAMQYMEDWVQSIDGIDAVISMNDNMAAGAYEVVKGNAEFDDLLVYGVDGTAEAALLIQEGKMTSTSFQNAYELARMSVKMAHDILTGVQTDIVDTDIDCPLITLDNVSELIDAHKATGAIK